MHTRLHVPPSPIAHCRRLFEGVLHRATSGHGSCNEVLSKHSLNHHRSKRGILPGPLQAMWRAVGRGTRDPSTGSQLILLAAIKKQDMLAESSLGWFSGKEEPSYWHDELWLGFPGLSPRPRILEFLRNRGVAADTCDSERLPVKLNVAFGIPRDNRDPAWGRIRGAI